MRPEQLGPSVLTAHQSVFSKAGWPPKRNGRHYVNMVAIRELRDGRASSTNSSTGSVPTEVINTEDEDYDLDLPSHPPGFPRFPVFPPRRGDIVFNVSADEPVVDGETDEQRQLREQRPTPIAPDDVRTSNNKFHCTISTTLLTWSGTSQSTRRQAPTWLSLWLI